jgi:predicted nucleic acid-binding protein
MRRVLFDTNILLDVLLQRMPWQADASAIFAAAQAGHLVVCVSALTIANIFYVARRLVGLGKARAAVRDCLQACEIFPLDRSALEQADLLSGSDYEDNIQIACAVSGKVDAIVTRDPRGFAHSPIAVLSPGELRKQISRPSVL